MGTDRWLKKIKTTSLGSTAIKLSIRIKTKLSPTILFLLINLKLRPLKKTSAVIGEVIQPLGSMPLR